MSRLVVAGLSLVLLLAACSDDRMGQPEERQHVPAVGDTALIMLCARRDSNP